MTWTKFNIFLWFVTFKRTVGTNHFTDPSKVLGAGSQRAVRSGPLRLAVEADVAVAVGVHFAGSVMGAVVLAKSAGSSASDVSYHLTPELCCEWWSTRGGLIRLLRGFTRRLTTGLRCGWWSWFKSGNSCWITSGWSGRSTYTGIN